MADLILGDARIPARLALVTDLVMVDMANLVPRDTAIATGLSDFSVGPGERE